jgi:methanogenic corrinoid protein MtbC1
MTFDETVYESIRRSVATGFPEETQRIMAELDFSVCDASRIFEALNEGLHEARRNLSSTSMTVAEFLLNIDAFNAGAGFIRERLAQGGDRTRAVVGVVEGDVHTLGAAIVAEVMRALGYDVTLLGRGTSPDVFMETVRETGASILCLSSMMTTTLAAMRDTMDRARREFPGVSVLVGGAALDASIAETLGADGYAFSAVELPAELERIVSCPEKNIRKYTDYERKIHVVEPAGTREKKNLPRPM